MGIHSDNGVKAKTVLVVGADRLGCIPRKLEAEGYSDIIHWSGRHKSCLTRPIPHHVDAVFLYWDFINHGLMNSIKRQAKERGIPVIYNRRKTSTAH